MWTSLCLCLAIAPQDPRVAHQELIAFDAWLINLAADDAGKTLYAMTQDTDGEARLHAFDRKQGKCVWTTKLFGPEQFVAISDSLVFTSGPQGGVAVSWSSYDRPTGEKRGAQVVVTLTDQSTSGMTADPRNRWVWLGTDKGFVARVAPGNSKEWSRRSLDNGGVRAMAVDPKGKTLAVGGADGTVRFVDDSSAKVDDKHVWKGHAAPVTTIVWSDNGSLLVSGDESGRVLVRAVATGKERGAFQAHTGAVQCLSLHPKGGWLASGDATGSVRCSHAESGAELARVALPKASATVEPKSAVRIQRTKTGVVGLTFVEQGDRLIAAGDNLLVAFDVSAVGSK